MSGGNHSESEPASGTGGNLGDQLVNSALRYRGQAPLVDSILAEPGLDAGSINGLTKPLRPRAQTDEES